MGLKERIQQIKAEKAAQLRQKVEGIKWSEEEIEQQRLRELKKKLVVKAILSLCMPVLEELNEECLKKRGFFIRSEPDTLKVVWDVEEVEDKRNDFRGYRGKAISVTAKPYGWVDICGNITWDEIISSGGRYSFTEKVTKVREGRVCSSLRLEKLGLMRKVGFKREELEAAVARAFLEPASWEMSKDIFEDLFPMEEIREKAVLLG